MKKVLCDAAEQVGGDLSNLNWQWFIANGPHGPEFSWAPAKHGAPGYCGLEHLKEIVSEKSAIAIGFPEEARSIAKAALYSTNTELIRRALQVLAVVGAQQEIKEIIPFTQHMESKVSNDAKACLFELKKRSYA